MEKLARVQYLSEKDPQICATLYLDLQHENVLMSLFKLSRDEKDKGMYVFFIQEFQEKKILAVALKNAYVLMGKHRLDLAARERRSMEMVMKLSSIERLQLEGVRKVLIFT